MKPFVSILFLLIMSQFSYSQSAEVFTHTDEHPVFGDELPVYPGCDTITDQEKRNECTTQAMNAFIQNEVIIPEKFKNSFLREKVFVRYHIQEKGSIARLEILRGAGNGSIALNKEALRVFGLLPQMIPAKLNGKAIEVQYKRSTV